MVIAWGKYINFNEAHSLVQSFLLSNLECFTQGRELARLKMRRAHTAICMANLSIAIRGYTGRHSMFFYASQIIIFKNGVEC